MKRSTKSFPIVLRKSWILLNKSNPLILASSTAFFATFSLSPIIILLVNVMSIYFESDTISKKLLLIIKTTFGPQVEKQIGAIVNNLRSIEGKGWITVGGFLFLLFIATTLLKVVRQSIHVLWHISSKPENMLRVNFIERSKASALILLIGLLFLASLVMDGSVTLLKQYLRELHPSLNIFFIQSLNVILSVLLITIWLTILFKLLPAAIVAWKVAFAGGLITGLLFNLGKIILGYVLVYSNIANVFGASTSFALILLFIFYSSMILYFGAAFTYVYGLAVKKPIRPGKYADRYEEKILPVEE